MSNEVNELVAKYFPDEAPALVPETPAGKPAEEHPVDQLAKLENPVDPPAAPEAPAEPEKPAEVAQTSSDFLNELKGKGKEDTEVSKLQAENLKYKSIEEALKHKDANPLAVLQALGIDIEKLNDAQVKKDEKPEEETAMDIVKKMQQENQKKADAQVYEDMVTDTINETKDNAEYELINSFGNHKEVVEFIINSYNAGQQLSYGQAAKMVEADMEKRIYDAYDILNKTSKYKSKYGLQSEKPLSESTPSEIKNLTNSHSSQVGGDAKPPAYADEAEEEAYLMKKYGI